MLPFGTGIVQEAYHSFDFTCNVVAGHLLSESFELLLYSTVKNFSGCFIFKKWSLNTTDIIKEVPVTDGLHPITLPSRKTHNQALAKQEISTYVMKDGTKSSFMFRLDASKTCRRFTRISRRFQWQSKMISNAHRSSYQR